jgi:hypothetical protein
MARATAVHVVVTVPDFPKQLFISFSVGIIFLAD